MTIERRRNPRIEVLGRLYGRTVTLDLQVTVVEISLGGMRIQTEIPLPVGSSHAFQLTLGDGSAVPLAGRVMYSRKVVDEDGERYVIGIQFTEDEPESVADLIVGTT